MRRLFANLIGAGLALASTLPGLAYAQSAKEAELELAKRPLLLAPTVFEDLPEDSAFAPPPTLLNRLGPTLLVQTGEDSFELRRVRVQGTGVPPLCTQLLYNDTSVFNKVCQGAPLALTGQGFWLRNKGFIDANVSLSSSLCAGIDCRELPASLCVAPLVYSPLSESCQVLSFAACGPSQIFDAGSATCRPLTKSEAICGRTERFDAVSGTCAPIAPPCAPQPACDLDDPNNWELSIPQQKLGPFDLPFAFAPEHTGWHIFQSQRSGLLAAVINATTNREALQTLADQMQDNEVLLLD